MKTVKQLRIQMDLSQPDMAAYLGIGRSTLTNVERGNRSLPTRALEKLAVLESYVLKATGKDSSADLPCNDLTEYIRNHVLLEQNLLYQIAGYRKKLEELDRLYESNHLTYTTIKNMQEDNAGDHRWIISVKKKAMSKIRTCSIPIRDKLRDRLDKLCSDAARVRQYLESHNIQPMNI